MKTTVADARHAKTPSPNPFGLRHRTAREAVVASQRGRVLEALVKVVARKGYPATTVADIVARAGISRRTFYEQFWDKEECFLAALDTGIDFVRARIDQEFATLDPHDWRAHVQVLLETCLATLAIEPEFTKVLHVDALAAGEQARARWSQTLERFVARYRSLHAIAREEEPDVPPVSDETLLLLAGSLPEVVREYLRTDRVERLPELAPQLISLAMAVVSGAVESGARLRSRRSPHPEGEFMARKVYVVGVGMTKFEKPGSRGWDYPDMAKEAGEKALADAGIPYAEVEQAAVGYCYGDSTCGQRAVYELGLTGIPVYNVNNNCSTGSTALFMAKQLVEGGMADCVLALGFEKMEKGSLGAKFSDRTNPLDKHFELMVVAARLRARAAHARSSSATRHASTWSATARRPSSSRRSARRTTSTRSTTRTRSSRTSTRSTASSSAPMVYEPLTKLQCCPTSDGAAAAILASEDFVRKHGLRSRRSRSRAWR